MANYIETSPQLFARLNALPDACQRRLWSGLAKANARIGKLLLEQEALAGQQGWQSVLFLQLVHKAYELWGAPAASATGADKRHHVAAARRQAAALAVERMGWSFARTARELRRHPAGVYRGHVKHVQDVHSSPEYAERYRALLQEFQTLSD